MKTKLALYDVHTADHDFYLQVFGDDFEVVVTEQGLSSQTAGLAADAEALAIHVTSPVTPEVMRLMPKLRHVACRSTGYDHVDLEYTKAHGISVSSVPSYGEATVAEYAFMLLLAVSRRLMLAAHSVRAGTVTAEKLTGHDLHGKTFGVIGTGRIGRHAATIAKGFGMGVIAYDPYPNEAAAKKIGYEYVPLDELFARADCISLHAPATPETRYLLGEAAFAKMKPGVVIVNTARGSLIDTPALIHALNDQKVAGAGLDVLDGEEYLQVASEMHLLEQRDLGDEAKQALGIDILTKMPNVLITSHNAYNSVEALGRIRDTTVANIKAWHAGKVENLVS